MNCYIFLVLAVGYGDEWMCSSNCILLSKGLYEVITKLLSISYMLAA